MQIDRIMLEKANINEITGELYLSFDQDKGMPTL
jgi:hypothetical protein